MTSLPARRAFGAGIGVAALTATLIAGASPAAAKPAPTPTEPVPLQLLALNDFHGQLERPTGSSSQLPGQPGRTNVDAATGQPVGNGYGGVEYLSTQVQQLEAAAQDPNTLTVAAGDLIGASPLLSAAFHDEPTIDALNRIGLDYASVGNHEFDEGPDELLRIQNGGCHPEDGCSDPALPYAGADFEYLSANAFVTETGDTLLPPFAIRKVQGIKVGFIGMTLEGTPGVVTPSGVAGLTFADEAETANKYAGILQRAGAEAIVVLVHEGGVQTSASDVNGCNGMSGPITSIVPQFDAAIDVVITGHTHQAYNCRQIGNSFVPTSSTSTGRLVTSAASVGRLVTDIDLTLDPVTGDVLTSTANNVVVGQDVPADPEMTGLIAHWRQLLGPIASEVVGEANGVLSRTQETLTVNTSATTTRNYNGESPIGDLIADGQLDATPDSVAAFMNPGGVRAEILSGPITYEEAFAVQPFGNYLSQITMTDAQIQCVLEQQFALGTILQPAGITYSVDRNGVTSSTATPCNGSRVIDDSVVIDGQPITTDGIDSYRITVNNFLADGGDSFSTFKGGANRVDVTSPEDDLAALVRYLGLTAPTSAPATDRITLVG
jgi:5'-nucleotidase